MYRYTNMDNNDSHISQNGYIRVYPINISDFNMTGDDETKCGDTIKAAAANDIFKQGLVEIIESIDLADSVLNKTRRVALGLLEQVESKDNAG